MIEAIVVACLGPLIVYGLVYLLHRWLPGRIVDGYLTDEGGAPLRYLINGRWVLLVLLLLITGLTLSGLFDWTSFYAYRWSMLAGACVLGLVYTLQLVLTAPSTGKPLIADLFLGRTENRFYGPVDAKMYLYLAGACMLFLNTVSFAMFHGRTLPEANPGVYLHAALLCFFVLDYLTFERVHLYTYDLFAERLGFKLAWGCLVFYPFFYVVGLWGTVELPTPTVIEMLGPLWLGFSALVFFAGWALARGANMQKYYFKLDPSRPFLGIAPQEVADNQGRLLCSGFWGIARHVNYLGEILMATGLALSLGHFDVVWPWLYPLYYVLLLGTRERDDDRRCEEKYGPLWDEYRRRVPYRIVPGVY